MDKKIPKCQIIYLEELSEKSKILHQEWKEACLAKEIASKNSCLAQKEWDRTLVKLENSQCLCGNC